MRFKARNAYRYFKNAGIKSIKLLVLYESDWLTLFLHNTVQKYELHIKF